MLSLLLVLQANAADRCDPLDEGEFASLLVGAQLAADRGEATLHQTFIDQVRGRVPCLQFAPAPRQWADFLVMEALAEFGRGGDWQTPLTAAQWLRPGVDVGVRGAHPMAKFVPPPAPGPGRPAPEGVVLYVDGIRADHLPPPVGTWLVQVSAQDQWKTERVTSSEVDDAWLTTPPEVPWRWSAWGNLDVGGACGGGRQSPASEAERGWAFVPPDEELRVWPEVVARGGVGFGPLTLSARAGGALAISSGPTGQRTANGELAFGGRWKSVVLGVGGGVAGVGVQEGDLARGTVDDPAWRGRDVTVGYGLVSVELWPVGWDAGAVGAWGPSHGHVELWGGWLPSRFKALRVGLRAGANTSSLVQQGTVRQAALQSWTAAAEVGVAGRRGHR